MQPNSYLISLITVDPTYPQPLYYQVYESLRRAIHAGQLSPGMKLPSSRDLTELLNLSRNTVNNALAQLAAEGYLETRPKQGTFVTHEIPEMSLSPMLSDEVVTPHLPARAISRQGQRLAGTKPHQERKGARQNIFTNGIPDLEHFPFDIWAQLTAQHYRYAPLELFDEMMPPAGYEPLRQAIADHLRVARAVNCVAEQVIIVSGSQQGFYLAANMLLDPGDKVWMEEPGCMGPRAACLSQGAALIGVPVDEAGMDVEKAMVIAPDARVAYINPSHQYPLGVTLSLARRYQLLQWAAEHGSWIIEDDFDSEFRYSGRPLASVQGLDRHGVVIYIGTFSKVLFPGLRLGYMVVPREVAASFTAARAVIDKYPQVINQIVLADFIKQGHFDRHLRRMRKHYDRKRRMLLEALQQEVGEVLQLGPADAGMHICGYLPDELPDVEVASVAAEQGIELLPLSEFYIGTKPHNGLILGYTAIPLEHIRDGTRMLKRAIEETRNRLRG
jgi:GntR family transcriptional regulator/MocR family aminotransferase